MTRNNGGLSMETRKYGPKRADHPSVGKECQVCKTAFAAGDFTTLIALGPGDAEEVEKAKLGRPYNAVAVEVHFHCAGASYEHIRPDGS